MTNPPASGFDEAATVWTLTQRLCERLAAEVDCVGCIVSRAIGDVLVQVAEHADDGRSFQLGRGFLVSQFPTTSQVLRIGRARSVSAQDPRADPAELEVLRALDVQAVLMLSLRGEAGAWGLVEIYRIDPPGFAPAEIERSQTIVSACETRLQALVAARRR